MMLYLQFLKQFFKFRHKFYAAFTLSGFDDQERNLSFVKTAFQV